MANAPEQQPIIRTMKSDADELLKKEKSSFLELFAKEEAKERAAGAAPPTARLEPHAPSRMRGLGHVIVRDFFILVVVGALGLGGFLAWQNFSMSRPPTNEPPPEPTPPRALLGGIENTKIIRVNTNDRTGLLNALENVPALEPYTFYPILVEGQKFMTAQDFFETLRISPPSQDFYNGISPRMDFYTLGDDHIFIFEVLEKERVQGNLLRWEKTLPQQFYPVFLGRIAGSYEFQDRIIQNVDARIAVEAEGTDDSSLSYAIVREEFLVFATREATLRLTIERLLAQ